MLELLQHLVHLGWRRSGARLRRLQVRGAGVFYAEWPALPRRAGSRPPGRAPTVILLHGLGASGTSFHPVIAHLRRGYRVLVPDLPGCGRSRLPRGRAFLSFAELVDVVEGFVARVAPRGAYVAGNSMGGWMAAKLAARRPDLVRAVGLLNPGGPALRAEDWVDFARVLMAEERGAVDEWVERTFHRPPLWVRLLKRDFRRIMRGPAVRQLMGSLTAEDFLSEAEAARVRCPAVLVWGDRDRLIPEGCRAFYLRRLRGVRYEPVPDCGHCPQLECPHRTAEILLELPRMPRAAAPAHAQRAQRAAGPSSFSG